MDYAAVTEQFIAANFPRADIAIVAGSTSRDERTATSDIDLLLIGEALFDDGRTSAAATYYFEGEIFEVFAYTPSGYDEWAQRDIERHRPVIVHMLIEGISIRQDASLEALRARWGAVLEAGPELTEEESRLRRYIITDALDDLRDASDPLELQVLASALFERTAELILLEAGHWIGTGKWLPRRLRVFDSERTEQLTTPLLRDDYAAFADRVEAELVRAGGRVQAGFVR
ncbi:hypothetical protein Q9R19_04565 [Microbacterium sp. ARD32]|uniref:hypothetical protein n=1 Tax=Microbacterium sp. ARD32 TaxID=2962577 RepID=UPI002881140A|nr:hypothetical protein [Microbacterium sp. ARD32]MDT0156897.1 hypothetical protein [Microbacterium sp. ARD32]